MDMTTPPPRAARRRSAPWRWLLPLLALALAGLAWLWRGGLTADAPTGEPAAAAEAGALASEASPADAAAPLPMLPPEPQFSGDAALAYARARDGDAEAARELALALADCNGFELVSEDVVRERFARFVSTPGLRFEGVDLADERQLAVVFEIGMLQRARCAAAPRVDLPAAEAKALVAALVEHAARAGDAEARARYGRIALAPFGGPREVVAHADEVARRHAQGEAWLAEALARREPVALAEQGTALLDGRYGPRDPEAAAMHLLAYTLLEPTLPRDDEARGVIASIVLNGAGVSADRQADVIDGALVLRDAWDGGP